MTWRRRAISQIKIRHCPDAVKRPANRRIGTGIGYITPYGVIYTCRYRVHSPLPPGIRNTDTG